VPSQSSTVAATNVQQVHTLIKPSLTIDGIRLAGTSAFSRILRNTTELDQSTVTSIVSNLLPFIKHSDRSLQRDTISALNNCALRCIQKRMDVNVTTQLVNGFPTIGSRLLTTELLEEVDVILHETLLTNIIIASYQHDQPIDDLPTFVNSYVKSLPNAATTQLTMNRFSSASAFFAAFGSYIKHFKQPYNEYLEALRSYYNKAVTGTSQSGKLLTTVAGFLLSTYSGAASLIYADVFNEWNYQINENVLDDAKQLLTPYLHQLSAKQLSDNDAAFYYSVVSTMSHILRNSNLNGELSNSLHRIWQMLFTDQKAEPYHIEIARSYGIIVAIRPTALLPSLVEQLNTQMGLHALLRVTWKLSSVYVGSEPQRQGALNRHPQLASLVPILQKHTAEIVKAISVYHPAAVDYEQQVSIFAFLVTHFPVIIYTYFSQLNPIFIKAIEQGIKYVTDAPTADAEQKYQQFFLSLQEFLPTLLIGLSSNDIEIQKAMLELIQYIATTKPSVLTSETMMSIYAMLLQRQTEEATRSTLANGNLHAHDTSPVKTLTSVISSDAFTRAIIEKSADVSNIVSHLLDIIVNNVHNDTRTACHELFLALCSTLPIDSSNVEKLATCFNIIYNDIHSKPNTTLSDAFNSSSADTQASAVRTAHFVVSNQHLFPTITIDSPDFQQLANDGHVKSLQHGTSTLASHRLKATI
jgi:hypothetical protein